MILFLCILLVILVPVPEPWGAVVIIVGCLLEVVEIFVLRHWSRRMGRRMKPTTGAEAMVGKTATVVTPCRPGGSVRIHGELWDARCTDGADPGATVRVDAVDGLTLLVSPQG